jgi:hypothetical protein
MPRAAIPRSKSGFAFVGNTVLAAAGSVSRSEDDGATWSLDKSFDSGVSSLVTVGTTVALSCGSGVYLSSDEGVTWTPWNDGISERFRDSLSFLSGTDTHLYAGTSGAGVWRRAW